MWIVLLTMACNCAPRGTTVSDTGTPKAPPALKQGAPEIQAADAPRLYQECRERVEGPESPEECAQDSDCAQAGCSLELCVAKAQAQEAFSSCETRLCFAALEACTCQQGTCRWTLKGSSEASEAR